MNTQITNNDPFNKGVNDSQFNENLLIGNVNESGIQDINLSQL